MLEAFLFDDKGVHVILKVPIVEGQAETVEAQGGEELGVLFHEEVFEELVEEEVALLLAEDFEEGSPDLVLATWKAVHEVLHEHPAAEGSSA